MKIKKLDKIQSRSLAQRFMPKNVRVGESQQELAMDHSGTGPITPRITTAEERVLRLVSQGKTNKEIALLLGISPATVKRHLEKSLSKLGLRNRVELAVYRLTANSCPHHSISGCALRQFERKNELR
jgi:DNA-binding NarL/FixJ family response regulator